MKPFFAAVFFIFYAVLCFAEPDIAEPNLRLWNSKPRVFNKINPSRTTCDVKQRSVVIIHGYKGDVDSDDYKMFARRITDIEPKTNVFAIDWLALQANDPVRSASLIPDVAEWGKIKLFDKQCLAVPPENTHIIGFSHGSHIAALIGKRTKGQVRHITLLDPSTSKTHLLTWENLLGKGWTERCKNKWGILIFN